MFSTDLRAEISAHGLCYAEGQRKAHLMAVVDIGSRCALGWAVGPGANREFALRCWEQVCARMSGIGRPLEGKPSCIATSTASTRATTGCDRFCSAMACG